MGEEGWGIPIPNPQHSNPKHAGATISTIHLFLVCLFVGSHYRIALALALASKSSFLTLPLSVLEIFCSHSIKNFVVSK